MGSLNPISSFTTNIGRCLTSAIRKLNQGNDKNKRHCHVLLDSPPPEGTSWQHIVGVGLLTGIGFTMSLFIGSLAFPAEGYNVDVRVGVLLASVLAAGSGGYLRVAGGVAPAHSGLRRRLALTQ